MFEKLDLILKEYKEIEEKLQTNLDVKTLTELSKRLSDIKDIVDNYNLFLNKQKELKDLEELLELEQDITLKEMASEEKKELVQSLEAIQEKLKILLLPKDPNDGKNVIVEIKGATGGDEANLFAGDLYRMYSKYAESRGWKTELLNQTPGAQGGFTNLEFMIKGEKVYSTLKYESGVHRVQRVPETETQGRIHTSTATVLVLPEAEELDIQLSWNDIRVDFYCSSGPGGQSVNTTKSAVRLTHIPSGLVVTCQDGKSQHDNKDRAFIVLKSRLYDKLLEEKEGKEGAQRRALVGHGTRSEKIRTYNYPQNRVTDHRINLTLQRLDSIIEGNLNILIEPLLLEFEKLELERTKNE